MISTAGWFAGWLVGCLRLLACWLAASAGSRNKVQLISETPRTGFGKSNEECPDSRDLAVSRRVTLSSTKSEILSDCPVWDRMKRIISACSQVPMALAMALAMAIWKVQKS